mmetsp:Transcript_18251/g.25955  ORF Transcript_18251/g.25955 Transcript_18251/m.25955 type:complete len:131 (+) Transcript_18251:51-443(+)
MRVSLVTPLFLSAMDHNYNAALRVFGPPAMFDDLYLPPLPPNVVIETNREALVRLGHDLTLFENQQFSALDMYRRFGFDEDDRPYLGHCVESPCNDVTNEALLLIRIVDEDGIERALRWVPRDRIYMETG